VSGVGGTSTPHAPRGSTPARVAAFDFDGTLTRRDTLLPFLVHVAGRLAVGRALAAQAGPLARALCGRGDRGAVKEQVLGPLLAGRPLAELEALAELFADDAVARRLRPAMVRRLRAHLAAGDPVVVVTASPELAVAPIARRLGPVAVLGTRLEVAEDGRLTGRLTGANLRGAEKVRRLTEWLGDGGSTLHWAYGDSPGDRELLAAAAEPLWVGRRRHGRPAG